MNVLSAMSTTSHEVATLQPSPTAGPLTAEIIGIGHSSIASSRRCAPRIDSARWIGSSYERMKPGMLPPALNALPAPVITIALTERSLARWVQISCIPSCIASENALR
ncbi:unannotated protein [freshwater metagenome]|uniref:Unannotated protein n=1 Tax=freshwater metagenome TaxID=449393 RepID=A0A6J7MX43_9ZZZZ